MEARKEMPAQKEPFKDETHIGDIAAHQPLSGVKTVSAMSVKGFNGPTVVHIEKATDKKSA